MTRYRPFEYRKSCDSESRYFVAKYATKRSGGSFLAADVYILVWAVDTISQKEGWLGYEQQYGTGL